MYQYEIDNQEEDNLNLNAEKETLLNDMLNKIDNNLVRYETEQNMRGLNPIPSQDTGSLSGRSLI